MTTAINSDGFFCSKLINNSAHKIDNFLFCFSVLSPIKSVENCIVSKSVGGYSELSHPSQFTLNPGEEWNFKYGYEYSRHNPMNHTWGPQGGFSKSTKWKYNLFRYDGYRFSKNLLRGINPPSFRR